MNLAKSILRIWLGLNFLSLGLGLSLLESEVGDNVGQELPTDVEKLGLELSFDAEEASLLEIIGSIIGISAEEIATMLNITKVGLGVLETLAKIFQKVFDTENISFTFRQKPAAESQILSLFEIITLRLEQIQRGIEGTEVSLLSLAKGLPHMVRWEIALDTLEDYVNPINNLYHRFSYYQKHKMEVENHTLLDFADSVVSHSTNSIQALMANIHSMIAPSDPPLFTGSKRYDKEEYEVFNRVTSRMSTNLRRYVKDHPNARWEAKKRHQELTLRPSIFVMLEDALKNYDRCHYKQSPHQLVFGLYSLLGLTYARGYAMVSFSYTLLKYYEKGNFTIEKQFADSLYQHYGESLLRNGLSSLQRTSNSYRRCDPRQHIENETFVMVTELLQGYIENEVDLNSKGSCGSKCSSYKHSKVEGCYLPEKQYCGKHRRCKGEVHNCRYFHADSEVCISEIPHRRYDWIEYENGKRLGRGKGCDNLMKVDSWWRFLYHCSYCMCLCDDSSSPTSDRFVSLRPVVSDIADGMVVTGIRFTKNHRMIQMQIQQGKAMPQGQINHESIHWVEPETISVATKKFKENQDYFTLKYEARNIDLDHLTAPKDHVITGLKFRTLGPHLNLEVWVTPIDFTTGNLLPNLSYWISNDNTPVMAYNPRRKVKLYDPDDPRRSNSMSETLSNSDMFIELQPTSMEMDVSQLTVPFFDAQPVAPSPSTWLEGIQLYHRGRRGYGGFIGFKVFNYNLTKYFSDGFETITP